MLPKISTGVEKYDFNDLLKQNGIAKMREVLDTKIEIKRTELLKNPKKSLLTDLEKIKGSRLGEISQKSSSVPQKTEIQLER